MTKAKVNKGKLGESLAVDFLIKAGYIIVAKNYRTKDGEADIIAFDPQKTLVIVEVKTRSSFSFGIPEEAITPAKLNTLKKLAIFYQQKFAIGDCDLRIDLITVFLDKKEEAEINHFKNISGF